MWLLLCVYLDQRPTPVAYISNASTAFSADLQTNTIEIINRHLAGCDGNGTTSHEIFGAIETLNNSTTTFSILIIIVAVQIVELFFHFLNSLTEDTPFEEMVSSIENELMVVGFTSVIFKIMVHTSHFLNKEWYYALEYAGFFIFHGAVSGNCNNFVVILYPL